MFTRIKGVEIAVLSVTISPAQRAFLLNTAFSVTANTAQNVPEQYQADLTSIRVHLVKNPSHIQIQFSHSLSLANSKVLLILSLHKC